MKKKLMVLILIAFAVIFFIFRNISKDPSFPENHPRKTMMMGVSLDYPPFEFSSMGQPQGYDIDLAYMLADELGFNLDIKDMDFNTLIPALNSSKVDFIISAMSPSAERAQNVDFTRLYYKAKVALVTLDSVSSEEILQFTNKKIGVQMGSTMEAYIKAKQAATPSINVVSISKVPMLVEELKVARIDGMIVDAEIAQAVTAKNRGLKSFLINNFDGGNAIVLPKNSPLTGDFNKALDKLEREGKLRKLEEKWIRGNQS